MNRDLSQIARWAKQLERARENRDHFIVWAHGEGYSLREIADAAGLSHGGVKKIVDRESR